LEGLEEELEKFQNEQVSFFFRWDISQK
jgi:hypothetical protein